MRAVRANMAVSALAHASGEGQAYHMRGSRLFGQTVASSRSEWRCTAQAAAVAAAAVVAVVAVVG